MTLCARETPNALLTMIEERVELLLQRLIIIEEYTRWRWLHIQLCHLINLLKNVCDLTNIEQVEEKLDIFDDIGYLPRGMTQAPFTKLITRRLPPSVTMFNTISWMAKRIPHCKAEGNQDRSWTQVKSAGVDETSRMIADHNTRYIRLNSS